MEGKEEALRVELSLFIFDRVEVSAFSCHGENYPVRPVAAGKMQDCGSIGYLGGLAQYKFPERYNPALPVLLLNENIP